MAKKKKNNKSLQLYKNKLNKYNDNPNDYGNTYDDSSNQQRNYSDYNECDINDPGNIYKDDQSNFAQEMYESYIKKHPSKQKYLKYIYSIFLITLTLSTLISQINLYRYNNKLEHYNKLNDSYNELSIYKYKNLEKTKKTTYPLFIKMFPNTKDFSKYCLPCNSLYKDFNDVFNMKLMKRKLENIKNIPLNETDLYLKIASKTNQYIDYYSKPTFLSGFDIQKKKSVTDMNQTFRILRSWLWASFYYASQKRTNEALLLAYAPILVSQDIEANTADGADINPELIQIQIEACYQLLFLTNYIETNDILCKTISKHLMHVINDEPSFTRKIENSMRRDNNFYSFLEKQGNVYAKYINNSKIYKDFYDTLYNGAIEQVKEIEKTGDYSKFYSWQKDIIKKFDISNSNQNDWDTEFKNIETSMCKKAFSNSIINFYNYYCLNLEKKAIMKGTAIALGLRAYNESFPSNGLVEAPILYEWLKIDISKDSILTKAYKFYYDNKQDLCVSVIKNNYYKGNYIKDDTYLPLLLNDYKNNIRKMNLFGDEN